MLGLRALARLFRRRPTPPVIPGPRLAEVIPLALAEKAMADGCPTPDQELMLMAAGSPAHKARRHPSLVRPQWTKNHPIR
ncbi:hypothetical protein [Kutzneria chonburiensis]|uniref:Uncharacterized protein n=1 Tax=Kutzneria chonburiensis TaxID=1483604 RepID=A0ABV6MQE1_9PSEU|nr:hypothetical protein [Kutzneria chonburiensis]